MSGGFPSASFCGYFALIAADSHRAIKGKIYREEVHRGHVRTKGAGHPHADNAEADSTAQLKAAIPIVFIGIQRAAVSRLSSDDLSSHLHRSRHKKTV